MKFSIDKSFIRDTKKSPKQIQKLIPSILLAIEASGTINEIPKTIKMSGYSNCYRIKLKDYRIGFYIENEVIVLSRLLARKDIYNSFP